MGALAISSALLLTPICPTVRGKLADPHLGLFAFLLLHALTGLALLLFTLRGDVKSYTGMNTTFGFLMMDIQKCSMSFILFWTLFYGLVYLF